MKPQKLLARPSWVDGESWPGYLLRLANANEILGIRSLAGLLDVPFRSLFVAQPRDVLRALGVAASDAPKVAYRSLLIQASRASKPATKHHRDPILVQGRRADAAVCPHCLASDSIPHVRAIWERPLEIGCALHGVELLVRCTACGDKLRAERPNLLECPCGAPLANQVVPKLRISWSLIQYAFNLERANPEKETFQPIRREEAVAASVIERLAVYERQHTPNPRKRRVGAKPTTADVQLAAPWFVDWPKQFEHRYRAALERGRTVGDQQRTSYIQSKTLFAPMFPRLHRAAKRVARVVNLRPRFSLQLGVEDYLSSAHQSVGSAAKLLGISRPYVWWLAASGALPGAERVSEYAMCIPTESVLDLMVEFSQTEHWKDSADRRGLSHRTTKQLLRTGLIPAIALGAYGECRVEPAAWDQFADFLLATSQPLPDRLSRSVLRLHSVIAASQSPTPDPGRTARILSAIGSGTLAIYTRCRTPRRLDDLLVSISQLRMVAQRNG